MFQIGQPIVGFSAVLIVLLIAPDPPAIGSQHAGAGLLSTPIAPATILEAPEEYAEQQVVIRGRVGSTKRAVFPNGRPYHTLSVGDERASLTVFSWDRPSVKEGDSVQVVGVFHVWRYNIHHVIESHRITRLGKTR